MLKFREWLIKEMAARSRPRAQKLLNYVAKKQRAYTRDYSDTPQTTKDTQIHTLIPHINSFKVPPLSHPGTGKKVFPYDHAVSEGQIERVPLKDVITTQDYVQKEVVAKKIQGKWKGHYPEHPHMVYIDSPGHKLHGKYLTVDGNHRANSARLQGKTHIKAKVATAIVHPDYIEPEHY